GAVCDGGCGRDSAHISFIHAVIQVAENAGMAADTGVQPVHGKAEVVAEHAVAFFFVAGDVVIKPAAVDAHAAYAPSGDEAVEDAGYFAVNPKVAIEERGLVGQFRKRDGVVVGIMLQICCNAVVEEAAVSGNNDASVFIKVTMTGVPGAGGAMFGMGNFRSVVHPQNPVERSKRSGKHLRGGRA